MGIGNNRKICMDKINLIWTNIIIMVELDENLWDTWPGNETRGSQARQVVVR